MDAVPERQARRVRRGEPGCEDHRDHQAGERRVEGALGGGARTVGRQGGGGEGGLRQGDGELHAAAGVALGAEGEEGEEGQGPERAEAPGERVDAVPERQARRVPRGAPEREDVGDHEAGERRVEGALGVGPRAVGRQGGGGEGGLRQGDGELQARGGVQRG